MNTTTTMNTDMKLYATDITSPKSIAAHIEQNAENWSIDTFDTYTTAETNLAETVKSLYADILIDWFVETNPEYSLYHSTSLSPEGSKTVIVGPREVTAIDIQAVASVDYTREAVHCRLAMNIEGYMDDDTHTRYLNDHHGGRHNCWTDH